MVLVGQGIGLELSNLWDGMSRGEKLRTLLVLVDEDKDLKNEYWLKICHMK